MANANRVGELKTLQAAAAGAANGTALALDDAVGALFEVSGTFTNLTVNWEASIDGGATYSVVAVASLASTTRARATTATATGLYLLESAPGLTHVRARVTAGAATGSITVKGCKVLVI
jgi:hypothetical protein